MEEMKLTPGTTEGPYYKKDSPEKARLYESGIPGEKLVLTGYVYDTRGKPVAGAWLDFWHANGNGRYDNAGYTLRGHQFTDASGKYKLDTVVPGGYTGRTPHIHVKVKAPGSRSTLTSHVFFPGLDTNNTDPIFRDNLVVEISDVPGGKSATFNFVILP
jgi:protocatechuate 3,4-dioxygenase beta subunit